MSIKKILLIFIIVVSGVFFIIVTSSIVKDGGRNLLNFLSRTDKTISSFKNNEAILFERSITDKLRILNQ